MAHSNHNSEQTIRQIVHGLNGHPNPTERPLVRILNQPGLWEGLPSAGSPQTYWLKHQPTFARAVDRICDSTLEAVQTVLNGQGLSADLAHAHSRLPPVLSDRFRREISRCLASGYNWQASRTHWQTFARILAETITAELWHTELTRTSGIA